MIVCVYLHALEYDCLIKIPDYHQEHRELQLLNKS